MQIKFNHRTFAGDRIGKLIREAAINGLLDDAALEVGFVACDIDIVQGVPSEQRLGFVDLDFECSTVCPTLLGPMGIWQKRLGKMVEHRNQSQPNPGLSSLGTPCMGMEFDATKSIRTSL